MTNVVNLKDYLKTLEDQVIKNSLDTGEQVMWDILDYEPQGTDNTGIIFSIWSGLLIQLYLRGWSKEDFLKELDTYEKIAKDIEEA